LLRLNVLVHGEGRLHARMTEKFRYHLCRITPEQLGGKRMPKVMPTPEHDSEFLGYWSEIAIGGVFGIHRGPGSGPEDPPGWSASPGSRSTGSLADTRKSRRGGPPGRCGDSPNSARRQSGHRQHSLLLAFRLLGLETRTRDLCRDRAP
jgi:hypothetical protein